MRLRFLVGIAALLPIFAATAASAQVPETPGEAPPAVPSWQSAVTISLALDTGVTDQRQFAITADSFKRIPADQPKAWSYAIQGDYTYASVKVEGNFLKIADSQNLRFTAQRALSERLFVIARPAFKRNEIQGIEYRYEALGGLGLELHEGSFGEIDVIGVAGGVQQQKGVPQADGASFVVGTVQTSQWALPRQWRLTQMFLYLAPVDYADDYHLQFQAALRGAITQHVAIRIAYDLDRENVVLGGSTQAQKKFSIGAQLTF